MINLHIKKEVFNEVYVPLIEDREHTTFVIYGSAGSGKSIATTMILLYRYLKQKRCCLVVKNTLASQRETCWKNFKDILDKWQITRYCTIKESEYKIQLPNGSEFLFRGLDDSNFEKVKSVTCDDLYIEEADQISQEIYMQLRARLRGSEYMSTWVLFNPVSKANWVYKQWFIKEPPKDTLVLKTTYKQNRFLPKQYIDWLESQIETDPVWYKIYVLGEFCSLTKTIYNNWQISSEEPPKDAELIVGLDWGFTNDPSCICISLVKEKQIWVIGEWYEIGKTNAEIAEAIKELGLAKSTIIADSAEPKSIEELKRAGIQRIKASKKGPDSILHGIQQLQQYQIKVNPNCTHLIEELENYSWKKDKATGEYINKPEGGEDHMCDCLRYSLQALQNRLKVLDKHKLGV